MGAARRLRRTSKVDSPPPHRLGCFGVASRLLLRSRPTTPHPYGAKADAFGQTALRRRQFSPLRGKSCAFGQTGLQPSPVFTPSGQRIRAVHTHLPLPAISPRNARYNSNRTSYMGAARRLRRPSSIGGVSRHRPFVTTSAHGLQNSALLPLRIPAQRAL